jgi:hypothetical protein
MWKEPQEEPVLYGGPRDKYDQERSNFRNKKSYVVLLHSMRCMTFTTGQMAKIAEVRMSGVHVRRYAEAEVQNAAAAYESVSAGGNGGRKLITQAMAHFW